jgi:hypothetical protein
LSSDTLFLTFLKLEEAFLETVIDTSVIAFVAFAANYSVLANCCLSGHISVAETGEHGEVTSLANAQKPPQSAWQGTFRPPASDAQVLCRATETSCFVSILAEASFSLHP